MMYSHANQRYVIANLYKKMCELGVRFTSPCLNEILRNWILLEDSEKIVEVLQKFKSDKRLIVHKPHLKQLWESVNLPDEIFVELEGFEIPKEITEKRKQTGLRHKLTDWAKLGPMAQHFRNEKSGKKTQKGDL